jgi:hypothetical protein
MNIDNLIIIKELGKGGDGIVYLVEDFNKQYAMKVEKFEEKLFNYELIFTQKIKKYPNFFIQLKNYSLFKLDKEVYIKKIYSLVDGEIMDIFDNLNQETKVSLVIQLLYSFYIMIKIGYFQIDINNYTNICYKKTSKKYVYLNIKGKRFKIKTYGYLIQIIDYNNILDLNDKSNGSFELVDFYHCLLPEKFYTISEKFLKDYVELIFLR